ncbi:hypothetical protein F5X99DRAFT_368188 [Biscogniauxia marginata]|nr:hypothetical protein F5X99DRAFT_368188 [Biscogniauxia marginata]
MSLKPCETPRKLIFPESRPERRPGQQQSSQAWTTARCHRLLRPLVSRIAILRKEAAASSFGSTSTTASSLPVAQPVLNHEGARKTGAEEKDESGWLMPRKKRARLTYSQRRTSPRQPVEGGPCQSGGEGGDVSESIGAEKRTARVGLKRTVKCLRQQDEQQRRTAPRGEIVPPTPLLRRARGHIVSSPVSAPPAAVDTNPREPGFLYNDDSNTRTTKNRREPRRSKSFRNLDERLAKLRAQVPPERYGDLEAIYRSLDLLLKATAHSGDACRAPAKGPRSFLAMCLWKVPQYIAELDAWERWDAEQSGTVSTLDGIDTSAQIYNELESLGAHQGWKHLRVVVRADGLRAVREGISEGLFSDEFSQLLIDLCVQRSALSEAQELITALVDRQYPLPISTDSTFRQLPTLQPLLSLTSYTNMTGRTLFLFRQYSILLSSNNLPQDWLATLEFERIWGLAARALCTTGANNEAVAFMIEAISLLCSRKRTFTGSTETIQLEKDMLEATQRTLTSSLTILAAMSLLGENEPKSSCTQEANLQKVLLIGDRLRYILKACIAELESPTRRRTNTRLDMLYLALLLSSGRSQGNYVESRVKGSIMNIWRQQDIPKSAKGGRTRNHYDNLVSLISSIARSCSRGTSTPSHQCLEDLFHRLENLDIGSHILDSLKGAAAFLLAQQTNNVRDLIYAEKLGPHTRSDNGGGGDGSRHATRRTFFTGYRWDETIGEWVTVSPVADKKQQGRRRLLRSSSSTMTTNVVHQPANDAETSLLPTRSRSLIRRDTDSVADLETDRGSDVDSSSGSSSVGNKHHPHRVGLVGRRRGGGGIIPTRKRPRRASSHYSCDDDDDESLAASSPSNVTIHKTESRSRSSGRQVLLIQNIHQHHHDDELGGHEDEGDDNKENRTRTRMLARNPRRSSGKVVVLGTTKKPRASSSNNNSFSNRPRTTVEEGGAKVGGWERAAYSSDDELCL